jgi:hypothetical protein
VRKNKKAQIRIPQALRALTRTIRVPIPVLGLKRLAGVFNRANNIPASELGQQFGVARSRFLPMGLKDILDRQAGRPAKTKLSSEDRYILTEEDWYILTEAILENLLGVSGGNEITLRNVVFGTPPTVSREGTPDRVHTLLLRAVRTYAGKDVAARIKKCQHCNKWFADVTRNRSKLRCSARCTWRTWSRARRREASHTQARNRKAGRTLRTR